MCQFMARADRHMREILAVHLAVAPIRRSLGDPPTDSTPIVLIGVSLGAISLDEIQKWHKNMMRGKD